MTRGLGPAGARSASLVGPVVGHAIEDLLWAAAVASGFVTTGDWVWPDDNADRLLASNGSSRYQAYLALALARADGVTREDALGDPVGFFLWAWRQAVPPTMSPGYVDWKDPIATVRLLSDWEGVVNAELEVRVPPPVLPRSWRVGRPDGDDLTGHRVILGRTTLRIRMTGVPVVTPGADADAEQITTAAKRVVAEVCSSVNSAAAELLAELSRLWTPAAHQQPRLTPHNELGGAPLR